MSRPSEDRRIDNEIHRSKAGSDPLYPDDPSLAGNRRIAIVLLREAPVLPMDTSL